MITRKEINKFNKYIEFIKFCEAERKNPNIKDSMSKYLKRLSKSAQRTLVAKQRKSYINGKQYFDVNDTIFTNLKQILHIYKLLTTNDFYSNSEINVNYWVGLKALYLVLSDFGKKQISNIRLFNQLIDNIEDVDTSGYHFCGSKLFKNNILIYDVDNPHLNNNYKDNKFLLLRILVKLKLNSFFEYKREKIRKNINHLVYQDQLPKNEIFDILINNIDAYGITTKYSITLVSGFNSVNAKLCITNSSDSKLFMVDINNKTYKIYKGQQNKVKTTAFDDLDLTKPFNLNDYV